MCAPSLHDTPPLTLISTLSLHDALPIFDLDGAVGLLIEVHRTLCGRSAGRCEGRRRIDQRIDRTRYGALDRKSTRLNSSHMSISYAVFCLKKKKKVGGT